MATVNILIRKNSKDPANLNLRFTHGRNIDIFVPLNIYVNHAHWDSERQKIRNFIELKNRDVINSKLVGLKGYVFDEYNVGNMSGVIFDKIWLADLVKKYFERPVNEVNKTNLLHHVYYLDFVRYWLDDKAATWKNSKNKYLEHSAIEQYNSFYKIIEGFQKSKNVKLKLKTLSSTEIQGFVDYLQKEQNYSSETTKRHVGRFKFFCNRAEGLNLEVNKSYKEGVFVEKDDDILEPYLNEDEITRIFKYDFTHDVTMDNVRDNFIIGLWTGLRISDFNNRLNISNIKDDFIEIKTKKTSQWTSIPLHPHVKKVLSKRFGNLPEKISDQKFNDYIKDICMLCNIDEVIPGKIFDADTKRNKSGYYKKYLLVSSHICRRSFATNLFGLVPNSVIQNVGAWKTETMMLHYIKKSKREHAEILKKTWDEKYKD